MPLTVKSASERISRIGGSPSSHHVSIVESCFTDIGAQSIMFIAIVRSGFRVVEQAGKPCPVQTVHNVVRIGVRAVAGQQSIVSQ